MFVCGTNQQTTGQARNVPAASHNSGEDTGPPWATFVQYGVAPHFSTCSQLSRTGFREQTAQPSRSCFPAEYVTHAKPHCQLPANTPAADVQSDALTLIDNRRSRRNKTAMACFAAIFSPLVNLPQDANTNVLMII